MFDHRLWGSRRRGSGKISALRFTSPPPIRVSGPAAMIIVGGFMASLVIREATDADRRWAAGVMSSSEPWMTLRRSFDACLRSCSSSVDVLYIAECDGQPCGLALVRERGLAGAPYLVSLAVAEPDRSQGIG